MLFAGRPELRLPSSPETPRARALGWLFAACSGVTIVFAITLVQISSTYGKPFLSLVPALVVPVIVTFGAFQLHLWQCRRDDERYWTLERLRERHPALWYLYCSGSAAVPARHSSSGVSPQ